MRKVLKRNDLLDILKGKDVYSIDNEFYIFEKPVISSQLSKPFKVDVVTVIICSSGIAKGTINLKPYTVQPLSMMVVMPDQILQNEFASEDFSGLFVVMTKKFTDSLSIEERLPLNYHVVSSPSIPLSNEEFDAMKRFFYMLKRIIRIKDNPYRLEMAKHLTMSFFYGIGYYLHKIELSDKKTKKEQLVDKYINLVKTHYKSERGLEFYADKMCLTAKYMSKVVKEVTDKTANEWIDSFVILEAKALLKSTNMTIQQISDELSFPSQSFFGKYFKRLAELSPKEYRKS